MPDRQLDVLFIHPGGTEAVYQGLRSKYSAVETPTWSLLLAESCRAKGYGAAILDCDAERLTYRQTAARVAEADPRLVVFVVMGSEPNQSTVRMEGAISACRELKWCFSEYKTCFVGNHVSALPMEVLGERGVDFVLVGEGVYALHNLLATDLTNDLNNVKGIGWKRRSTEPSLEELVLNDTERIVPQDRMDIDLPGYAWDLLPYRQHPLDLYRAQYWQNSYKDEGRAPFAAIYSSLGCIYRCQFCCINLVNRTDHSEDITSADSNVMRYWSTDWILRQFDKLAVMGVKVGKLSDEMFFFKKAHYEPMLKALDERGYGRDMRFWAYARVDTVKPKQLDLFRLGGISSLVLGIESGNQTIRREVTKGQYDETDVRAVVREIEDAGLNVQTNYIFGLPDDDESTMQQTLDLGCELNTIAWNGYPCQSLPGTPLYLEAKKNGWELPKSFSGYGFYSYDCLPMRTKHCTAAEVLAFRDKAFHVYHERPAYLYKLEAKYGKVAREGVEAMCKVKLKRKLLGD